MVGRTRRWEDQTRRSVFDMGGFVVCSGDGSGRDDGIADVATCLFGRWGFDGSVIFSFFLGFFSRR